MVSGPAAVSHHSRSDDHSQRINEFEIRMLLETESKFQDGRENDFDFICARHLLFLPVWLELGVRQFNAACNG